LIPIRRRRILTQRLSAAEQRRRAGAITRKLRLLRGHRLLKKVSGTRRYVLTHKGREIVTALLAARQADVEKLSKMAPEESSPKCAIRRHSTAEAPRREGKAQNSLKT
jgi:hypothetical protein